MEWQSSATIENLQARARFLATIRDFFATNGYLEVETPVLAKHGVTDVYLQSVKASLQNQDYYLQTSPEYHMKRLLASGSGPIYQLFRAFRDDEVGRLHNPEFTLLEWYKLGGCQHVLIDEVGEFLQHMLACEPLLKISYKQVFIDACGIDPFNVTVAELRAVLQQFKLHKVLSADESDIDQYLFLLMSHVVEPFIAKYSQPVAIYDFPVSQAALAKVVNGVALRFEVYYMGIELANGFSELTDMQVQRQRFMQDNILRQERGLEVIAIDERFLQALEHGLPDSSGVALGVDRLLALSLGFDDISKVLAFVTSRA